MDFLEFFHHLYTIFVLPGSSGWQNSPDPNNPTENEVRRRSCDESV